MNILIAVNEAPGHGERSYNALRLATALTADGETEVRLFFMGDGAWCAAAGGRSTTITRTSRRLALRCPIAMPIQTSRTFL